LGPVDDLGDGEPRGGRDLANDAGDLISFDKALRLLGGRLRVDRILHHQLDLAAHHAACSVDLLKRELDAHLGKLAQRSKEAGQRCQVAELENILRPQDARKAHGGSCSQSRSAPHHTATRYLLRTKHVFPPNLCKLLGWSTPAMIG